MNRSVGLLLLAAALAAPDIVHAQTEVECRVSGTSLRATPEACAKLGGAGPAAAAPQASEQSAAQLYATWEQHRRSDHARAHAAAKEYLARFPNRQHAGALSAWVSAYERVVQQKNERVRDVAPATVREENRLSIATGDTRGIYYPLGQGIAAVLSKYVPRVQAAAEVTGGSLENLRRVGTGESFLGMCLGEPCRDAYTGENDFREGRLPLRTLLAMYPNYMHVVTLEGAGIGTMNDLRGKRVSTGSPGSATEAMSFRLIEAAGLDKDRDMRRERFGIVQSAEALRDRKVDAFFWLGGLPTAAIDDLTKGRGLKIKLIDHAHLVPLINRKVGNVYVESVIPKETYAGMAQDNRQGAVWNILLAHENLSEQAAYNIVRTILERRDEVIAAHRVAADLALGSQKANASPIPFHPGAIRYFKENGLRFD